jgi:hypothetical protein
MLVKYQLPSSEQVARIHGVMEYWSAGVLKRMGFFDVFFHHSTTP